MRILRLGQFADSARGTWTSRTAELCAPTLHLLLWYNSTMRSWDVAVAGRVVRVRPRQGGGWRVRLADTGGALAAAEIRSSHPLPPPRVGSRVLIRGHLHYNEDHGWYAVDPVEEWREARDV